MQNDTYIYKAINNNQDNYAIHPSQTLHKSRKIHCYICCIEMRSFGRQVLWSHYSLNHLVTEIHTSNSHYSDRLFYSNLRQEIDGRMYELNEDYSSIVFGKYYIQRVYYIYANCNTDISILALSVFHD